jgi:DNA-binding CsgD family transcriptional regulator
MTRQRGGLVGRRTELAALVDEQHQTGLTLVFGPPGSGKTALLRAALRAMAERGAPVLDVRFPADGPPWDLFGFRAVLTAVREQYENFDTDPRLPESLEGVSRLCTEESYADPWARFCLLHAVSTLFTRLSATAPVMVIFDGVDNVADPVLAVAPMHRAGHAVIASCRLSHGGPNPFSGVTARSIELGPLSNVETSALLRRALSAPVAPAAEQAVREALGPLWGNPDAVLSTATDLRDRGWIEVVDGLACLRDPARPIALPAGHRLFEVLESFGDAGRQLVLLAASPVEPLVEEISLLDGGEHGAKVLGQSLDALVQAGILECGPSGRIQCRVPGMGIAVAERETRDTQRLHRGIVERLLGNGWRQPETIVKYIAAAGRALPRNAEFVDALRTAECSLAADSSTRAAHLYAAWWHAGPGAGRTGPQIELVRHFVRIADYPALAAFVEESADDEPAGEQRAELAVAAVLAALHLGRPVPGGVRAALTQEDMVPPVLELADRWFTGERISPDEVANCVLPTWQQVGFAAPQPGRRVWRGRRLDARLADACAIRDLVPVFGAVLGGDYRIPVSGPSAVYHRARTGHAEGRWEEALNAVHELELEDSADGLAREHTRLLGAEMYGWRGEDRRAADWLAKVPENGHFPLLRAWVETGLRHHSGDIQEAFEIGWRACRTHSLAHDEFGASRLLLRLAWLANRIEGATRRRDVAEAAAVWHEQQGSSRSFELVNLVRSLLGGDETGMRITERLVRKRGDQHGLVLLSEAATRSSESPRRWLREAHEITRFNGAPRPAGRGADGARGPGSTVSVERAEEEQLTEKEFKLLELIRSGRTNRQIGRAVGISEKTVEKQLARLYAKARCRNKLGLAVSGLARRHDAIGA